MSVSSGPAYVVGVVTGLHCSVPSQPFMAND